MGYQDLLAYAAELRDKIAESEAYIAWAEDINMSKSQAPIDISQEIAYLEDLEDELDDVEDQIYRMVGC